MRDKRIVITGGAGFIGSNLAWSLSAENDVVVIDNLATGRIENIEEIIESKRIRFVKGSVTDLALMRDALNNADIVFHEAAIPSVSRSIENPIPTNEAGVTGTLTTLLAARDGGVKRLVFASSSSVYGESPTLPKHEELPMDPISPYGVTKATCEKYCSLFDRIYGLSTISLRYFNAYGPRQDPTSGYAAVIPGFVSKAMRGEALVIYGDGKQTRDFTYVEDVVRANILAAQSCVGGSFNIASAMQTEIVDLAANVLRATGSRATIVHEPPRAGDIRHSLADISKANKAFGYAPLYTIQRGLRSTVEWFSRCSHSCGK